MRLSPTFSPKNAIRKNPEILHAGTRILHAAIEALEDRILFSTVVVLRNDDGFPGIGTLRFAINHAHNGDTILLAPLFLHSPIVLTRGEIDITKNLTIEPLFGQPITISGNGASRVFTIEAGATVSMSKISIVNTGNLSTDPTLPDLGGGILNEGTLAMSHCSVSNCVATSDGGAICNFGGELTTDNCSFTNNSTMAREARSIVRAARSA